MVRHQAFKKQGVLCWWTKFNEIIPNLLLGIFGPFRAQGEACWGQKGVPFMAQREAGLTGRPIDGPGRPIEGPKGGPLRVQGKGPMRAQRDPH